MAISIPGISIGIVFHNEQERILKCLSALSSAYSEYVKQSSTLPVEFIFVDNKSTDSGSQVVEKFCRENYLPFSLYRTAANNMGRARNKVISSSKYSYLIFLDADCCPQKSWIQNYLKIIEDLKDEKWAAIGGENFPPITGDNALYNCQRLLKKHPQLFLSSTQLLQVHENRQVRHVPTCNALYKKDVLREIGGFQDSFVRVGEDLQLSARLIHGGWKIIFAPGIGVEHCDKTDFKSWFLKCFRYGSVQLRVLLSYPKATSSLRWVPALIILFLAAVFAWSSWFFVVFLFAGAVLVPAIIALVNKEARNLIPWILFLNGTVVFYSMGYAFGACKIVLQPSKLQNVSLLNEVD